MLHLTAGLGALALGGGILLREPRRARNRQFALLCAALAIWNLGLVLQSTAPQEQRFFWRLFFLTGSCSTAPIALHIVMVLVGVAPRLRRNALLATGAVALLLWLSAATPLYRTENRWQIAALVVLGTVLAVALVLLGRHAFRLPRGAERRAHLLIFWGGVIASTGGVSDFIPRDGLPLMRMGPPAVLVFLLMLCAVVVRHRFLDVHVFLARAVALLAGAGIVGLVFLAMTSWFGRRYIVLFFTSLLVLAAAGPVGRRILTRARALLAPEDPVARALLEISNSLTRATDRGQVWQAIEDGRRLLGRDVRLDVWLRRPGRERLELAYRSPRTGTGTHEELSADDPLVGWLQDEASPLSRRYLEQERRESGRERRERAAKALERLKALDLRLVVPLHRGESVSGWVGLGQALSERYLTAEVAAAFLAVGHQAQAGLDRIDALEAVKRKEALAAVGELAAGLAHEVRNPVAAIRGAAQALGPEATERQKTEMLEVLDEETERLGRFVGEFLDYARPGSPRREPVDLAAVARRSIEALRVTGVQIGWSLRAADGLPTVSGDPDQIRRAFENLILNASQAAGPDGHVAVELDEEDDGRVRVRFEDNGPGIPAEEVPLLFQPFHTTKTGGTGLGLALVHRIVEAHGGEVHVNGRAGEGAVFTLIFPTRPAAD